MTDTNEVLNITFKRENGKFLSNIETFTCIGLVYAIFNIKRNAQQHHDIIDNLPALACFAFMANDDLFDVDTDNPKDDFHYSIKVTETDVGANFQSTIEGNISSFDFIYMIRVLVSIAIQFLKEHESIDTMTAMDLIFSTIADIEIDEISSELLN